MKLNIITLLFFVMVGFLMGLILRDNILIHDIKKDGMIRLDGVFDARCIEKGERV